MIDKSQAKGLASRIFRNLYNVHTAESVIYTGMSNRKTCKMLKGLCKKNSSAVFIDERYAETNNWQLIWGEWSLFNPNAKIMTSFEELEAYDQIAFDLTIHTRNGASYKTYYVALSKHALVRLIMRCDESIKNPHNLNIFLKKITKKLIFDSLVLADQVKETGKEAEGYTIIDGYYLPMITTLSWNKQFQPAFYCNIKTFMPNSYDSAVTKLKSSPPLKPSSNFFDYESLFPILDKQSKAKCNI
jgi:hypothetical protein